MDLFVYKCIHVFDIIFCLNITIIYNLFPPQNKTFKT